jgi:hypothetical protein
MRSRSKGAASSRKRAVPPGTTASAAGAAPALSDLSDPVAFQAAFETLAGCRRLEAFIATRLMFDDMPRDKSERLKAAQRTIRDRKKEHVEAEQGQTDLDRAANIEALKQAIAGRKGSALRADMAVVPPMEAGAVRQDLASTTSRPGRGEALQ